MNRFKVGDRVETSHGVGTIVEIGNDPRRYLVKHDDWFGGHNGKIFAKRKHIGNRCSWFGGIDSELIKSQKVIITIDGNTVTARLKESGKELKKSSAKCNPSDTFDFETGAKLAFERLFEKKVKEVKRLAKVGEYIKIVNACANDRTYKNGDILEVKNYYTRDSVLCKDINIPMSKQEYVVLEGYEPPKEEPKPYNAKVVCVEGFDRYTTKGKIYEIKDGKIKWDKGTYSDDAFANVEMMNRECSSQFIEVVE